jgi:glutathione S-transferase
MFKLFEMGDSGNCYKIRLLLAMLDIEYERIPTDILNGESRTDAFLELNPNGKLPLLITPEGTPLAESNAILFYLACDTPYLPQDNLDQALTLQWMFFEQYSHEPFIATNRFWIHLERSAAEHAAQIEANHPRGMSALGVMETHLGDHTWFTPGNFGIADIALYAYTHVAHEGDYDLFEFSAVRKWLEKVTDQPGFISIDA